MSVNDSTLLFHNYNNQCLLLFFGLGQRATGNGQAPIDSTRHEEADAWE